MLVGFPAAYLLGSACADVWAHATERDGWFRTARNLNTLGIGSALVAAMPGLVDYLTAVGMDTGSVKHTVEQNRPGYVLDRQLTRNEEAPVVAVQLERL